MTNECRKDLPPSSFSMLGAKILANYELWFYTRLIIVVNYIFFISGLFTLLLEDFGKYSIEPHTCTGTVLTVIRKIETNLEVLLICYENISMGLLQVRRNSSALAMELHLSCINPSI